MRSKSLNQQKYTSRHPLRRFFLYRFLTKILSEIEKEKPQSILDIGCGEGEADKFFLKRNASLKVLGIDIDSEALKEAKINCPQIEIKKADVYKLPFPDNSFDLVLCLEVLEHLEKPDEALKEIKRVCYNKAIITVPNEPLFSLASFFSGKYLKSLGKHPEHRHFWSRGEFKNLLKKYFPKVEVKKAFPWLIGIASRRFNNEKN